MKNFKNRQNGITLVALVITIIILLILAGITIASLTNSGLFGRTKEAQDRHEYAAAKEIIDIKLHEIYVSCVMDNKDFNMENTAIEMTNDNNITIDEKYFNATSLKKDTVSDSIVNLKGIVVSANQYERFKFLVSGKNGSIQLLAYTTESVPDSWATGDLPTGFIAIGENKQATQSETPTTPPSTASYTITYNAGEGTSSKENDILQVGATIEETATRDGYSFLGWYDEETGGKVITTMPEKDINVYAHWLTTAEDGSTIFSTEYGRIDVIWLNADNTLRDTPNPPTNNLSGMTPVKWTETSTGWENEPVETTSSDPDWYDYTAGSGTSDNTSSRWANAKNGDSYFVWIPKFAYRITYYASQSSTEPIGYYDGWGQWSALDGKLKKELDPGIKSVTSGGNKYIVHPAFCGTYVGYDNGSWKDDISGFWVAKYEMSRDGASSSSQGSGTTFKCIPNVQSARDITIGDMYNGARSYDTSKESHLMKNSEWGAVAYLTQSQYGRNGNEIDINNSSSCITGNGGGSTSASRISKTSNEYNTTTGAKASTTGNIYGVYDISGGAWEYVAAFNSYDKNSYRTKYGKNGTTDTTLSNGTASTEYATKYSNATSNHSGNNIIYTYGKIGDATKEVNKGGEYVLNNTSSCNNWFGDYAPICYEDNPFILRGGANDNGNGAGIFSSYYLDGHKDTNYSFRAVLCP